ncbi:MAG: hypothetical protein E5Y58_35500, partial [Mesorhizobium sp.]
AGSEADAEPDAGADAEPAPPPEVIVDGPAESPASVAPPVSDAPPASDAPRSRVLPVVPDIMPEAAFPDAPEIDLSSPQSAGDGDAE